MASITIEKMMVPAHKYNIKCTYPMKPEFITIHNTANRASARAEVSYMIGNNNYTSYHFAVDNERAVQGLPLDRNGWHCGDGANGAGNRKSIGIEICYSLDPGHPLYAQSEENGAILTAHLLKQFGWGIDRIRKHQDWSGKYCPHRILDNGGWQAFLNKVQHYLGNAPAANTPKPQPTQKASGTSIVELADAVLAGKYGNGEARVKALGNLFDPVQSVVNKKLGHISDTTMKRDLAAFVLEGKLGNGEERKRNLGPLYSDVQGIVNQSRNTIEQPVNIYTVVPGDTLSGIGQKLGVIWQDIASMNGIRAPYIIHPGQQLKYKK